MRKTVLAMLALVLSATLLASCAGRKATMPPMTFTPAAIPGGQYESKLTNAQVILDASMTMGINNQKDLLTAKNLVSSINNSLPSGLAVNSGLRTFGHSDQQSSKATELVYGMAKHSQSAFQAGLDKVKYAGGPSPLPKAIEAAGSDLMKGDIGKSAIIIVSDGLQMDAAPAAMEALKGKMGADICAYTVQVGDDPAGRALLEKIAQAGQCGFATTASALSSQAGMASFVEKVFLTQKRVAVAAPAPAPAPVPPSDSDGDGVPDNRDKCPNTLPGVMVDENGCALKYTLQIEFDFDKAEIRPQHHAEIAKAAAFVKSYPKAQILVAGHTDSVGDDDYNKGLSKRRAVALVDYMVQNFGVSKSQLYPRGYGEERPIASNDTDEGRQQNRRVEFICCVVIPPEE